MTFFAFRLVCVGVECYGHRTYFIINFHIWVRGRCMQVKDFLEMPSLNIAISEHISIQLLSCLSFMGIMCAQASITLINYTSQTNNNWIKWFIWWTYQGASNYTKRQNRKKNELFITCKRNQRIIIVNVCRASSIRLNENEWKWREPLETTMLSVDAMQIIVHYFQWLCGNVPCRI